MAPPDPAFSARYRPFRVAMYLLFIGAVSAFALVAIISGVRSVLAMSPQPKPSSDVTLTERECLERADVLWRELDGRRKEMGEQVPATKADQTWMQFRVEWLERHREAMSLCALESQNRESLKRVFSRLDKLMDLYTTHVVQYSGEVGPTVDALRDAMESARQTSMGRASSP
jgi:hypothetical protein